jgi:hypothetical protein
MLLAFIPIVIFVNSIAAIPAAIWIKGRTESILVPVIISTFFLRSLASYLFGGADIIILLTIVLVGLGTAAGVNTIVINMRKRK